jgi:hypothetical protein
VASFNLWSKGGLLRPTWRRLAVIAVLALLACVYLLYFTPQKRAVRYRLSEADSKSAAALERSLQPLRELFAKGKRGSRPFADKALSWGGKWALVKGTLGGGDAHRKFLADAFKQHVFTQDELKGAMESAVRAYLADLEGVESEMLVLLRADLESIGGSESLSPDLRSDEAFRREYRKLADQVGGEMKMDFGVTVGREVGLLVASELATQAALQACRTVAAEMGVEGGLLGAGAVSSLETLGVGLVIAVILDYVIDAVFKAAGYDPAAKIAAQVRESLDEMEAALTRDPWFFSSRKTGALRQQLQKVHEARSKLRRQTIERFMREGGGK